MKKIILLLTIAMLLGCFSSFAQQSLFFCIGNIVINNDHPVSTTKEEILKNTHLTISPSIFEVVSYVLSIKADDKIWGPTKIKGSKLTKKIINKINNSKGQNVQVYIEEIKVKGPDERIRMLAGSALLRFSQ